MNKDSRIYIAGHRGMVGSAIFRKLEAEGYTDLITRTRDQLDLTRQTETEEFFKQEKPEYVFLAAARVGGILANSSYKAEFIYQNVMIAANIVESSYKFGVKKLLNLGSTCIYPKLAPQPLKEEYLLTGALEPTNNAYAMAKITAIKLCEHYVEQYGTNFLSCMPTNLYGPNDNYNLRTSHVLPALIRKFHLARLLSEKNFDGIRKDFQNHGSPTQINLIQAEDMEISKVLQSIGVQKCIITLWGSGSPYREFLHVDDLAEACLFLMRNFDAKDVGGFVNVGVGEDTQIREIAELIKEIVGYQGKIKWDSTKPDGCPKKLTDVTKINKLGWHSKIDLERGLTLVYEGYKNEEVEVV